MAQPELAFCALVIADLFEKEAIIVRIGGTRGFSDGVKFFKLYNYSLTLCLRTCDRE